MGLQICMTKTASNVTDTGPGKLTEQKQKPRRPSMLQNYMPTQSLLSPPPFLPAPSPPPPYPDYSKHFWHTGKKPPREKKRKVVTVQNIEGCTNVTGYARGRVGDTYTKKKHAIKPDDHTTEITKTHAHTGKGRQ